MIKRISLLMVAALMAAMMMVATAAPAFASPGSDACDVYNTDNDPTTSSFYGKNPDGGGFECTVITEEDVSPSQGVENDNRALPFHEKTTDSETTSGQGGGGGQETNPKHQDPPPEDTTTNRGGHEK